VEKLECHKEAFENFRSHQNLNLISRQGRGVAVLYILVLVCKKTSSEFVFCMSYTVDGLLRITTFQEEFRKRSGITKLSIYSNNVSERNLYEKTA
jgi:hypothetical protein